MTARDVIDEYLFVFLCSCLYSIKCIVEIGELTSLYSLTLSSKVFVILRRYIFTFSSTGHNHKPQSCENVDL